MVSRNDFGAVKLTSYQITHVGNLYLPLEPYGLDWLALISLDALIIVSIFLTSCEISFRNDWADLSMITVLESIFEKAELIAPH